MTGHTQVGNCPKCGAPIYSPSVYHSISPPPPEYTCNCNATSVMIRYTTSTGYYIINDWAYDEAERKEEA